jgi:hypothetical protein
MRNWTHKSPPNNTIIAHAHTSVYNCLIPSNPLRYPCEIQIWESGGS